MKNILVTKSNHLIEASYKLTLNEQRLILACIAQLDGRKPLPRDNMFTISALEFAETFDVSIDKTYSYLREASENLFKRKISRIDGRVRDDQRWVYRAQYFEGEAKVTIGFSPSVAPYLTMLHQQFTSYQLKQVSGLRSVNSIRIFEMLAQFRKTGKLLISLEDFKNRLELGDRYARFYDIKRRIIEPAVKELLIKSGLEIEWEAKREGRKVRSLEFTFKDIQQMSFNLE